MKITGFIAAVFLFFAFTTLCFCSCRKKTNSPEESQGTNFNVLLKTVTTTSTGQQTTEYFTYNTSGQLIQNKIITPDYTSNTSRVVDRIFYRTAAGRLDSIAYIQKIADTVYTAFKTELYYDFTGKVSYSLVLRYALNTTTINGKDSSVYFYSGTQPEHRDDYRNSGSGPYGSRIAQLFYQYDVAGNISSVRTELTSGPADTFTFTYDNKTNSLPDNSSLYFSFAPIFIFGYKSINNPAGIDYGNWSNNVSFEYRYTPNNKPLFRKMREAGTIYFEETLFYYD